MEKRKGGFTIIELIVVMTIILILAGLITGAAQKAKERAMVTKARAMIAALETALGMLQADEGIYPPSGIDKLYSSLTSTANLTTYGLSTVNWSGPYMNFQTNEVSGSNILDSWGSAYHYANPSDSSRSGFTNYVDIWSNGPNKTDNNGGSDDITNWRR